jgi:branched-chain amino acid transport system substrate-binding protein
MKKTWLAGSVAAGAILFAAGASAQVSDDVIKVGVLNDQSSIYADAAGKGSVELARMAAADWGGKLLGKPIEVITADHQNKADIAVSIARQWYDQDKVDMIVDLANSAVALAVQEVTRERKRVMIASSVGTSALTNKACSPYGIHYTYDTYSLANSTARAVVKSGGDSWFFVTADYSFGYTLEQDATNVINELGGKVVGRARHPLNTADMSSYLLQAQASKSKVVGFANASGDTINAIKQAVEFGVPQGGQKLAALLFQIVDVHAVGLKHAQGIYLTEAFYWDLNDETRAFSKRFFDKMGRMPTMVQAGVYSSVMHYFKAVEAAGTDDADKVMAKMREIKVNDFFAKDGYIRPDGRHVHDMYLFQIKKPEESKGPWDYYKLVATIKGEDAFIPAEKSECPLMKKG